MNTKHLVNIFLCFVYSAVIAHSVETRTAVLSGTNEVEQIAKAQDKASATTIFENTRKMAEQGNVDAQFLLALDYATGSGVETNLTQAADWFRKAAEQGHAEAQYFLACYYENGKGVKQDDVKAFEWYQEAANQGDSGAQTKLGRFFETGKGGKQDNSKAIEWYQKAAKQGNAEARCFLTIHIIKENGSKMDPIANAQAIANLPAVPTEFSEKDIFVPPLDSGTRYANGIGIEDAGMVAKWYRENVEHINTDADVLLERGLRYSNGEGVTKDDSMAFKCFRGAAEQGNFVAQYHLGICYSYGRGTKKDDGKAVEWLNKSAEQGYSEAKSALDWYHRTAEQGNAASQFGLGICFANGWSVQKDESKAVEWFQKAAEQRHMDALYALGACYQDGKGVEKDNGKAAKCFRKVAEEYRSRVKQLQQQLYQKWESKRSNKIRTSAFDERIYPYCPLLAAIACFVVCIKEITWEQKHRHKIRDNLPPESEVRLSFPEMSFAVLVALFVGIFMYSAFLSYQNNGIEKEREPPAFIKGYEATEQYALGVRYLEGNGVEENDEIAVEWLRKAAENYPKQEEEFRMMLSKSE